MLRAIRPAVGLRFGLCALSAVIALAAIGSDPADARGRRGKHHRGGGGAAVARYAPPYADLVMDANTGAVLHAENADSLRHPASLTKIMTLYLLFEQLETGKLRLDSRMEVSEHAAQQAPSKLGLAPGQTIAVEDAIRALVTKSANDAAVVIAETIGGDEDTFARLMTRKARALGMSRTVYNNASGLPDEEQLTTARDQVMLGRAIQDRFPRYYAYFKTPSFVYQGHAIRNHNRLLGKVEGVDGIKTGYTRASGFNLVTSLRRGNRHIVAAVLGGTSGASRDARMRSLVEQHIASASASRTIAKITESNEPAIAAAKPAEPVKVAEPKIAAEPKISAEPKVTVEQPKVASEPKTPFEQRFARADALGGAPDSEEPASATTGAVATQPTGVVSRTPKPGSGEAITPVKVKTITVKAGNVQTAMLVPLVSHAPQASVAPPSFAPSAALPPPPGARPGVLGVLPVDPPASQPGTYQMASATSVPVQLAPASTQPSRKIDPRRPWMIQVGAFPKEDEAKERLREAQSVGKTVVAKAEPFTERVTKGTAELYRARFAGFDQDAAEAACKYFKRNEIACMATKN
ncbi:MAG: D-alanyl-D-alanine carboxypeptidase [Hyphomicrobiales bacterium]